MYRGMLKPAKIDTIICGEMGMVIKYVLSMEKLSERYMHLYGT